MRISLLHNESCPSTSDALERIQRAIDRLGVQADLEVILVESEEQAVELGFRGSPTILVDGVDLEEGRNGSTSRDRPALNACRIYSKAEGRVSPLPPIELIEQAIERARTSESRIRQ